MTRLCARTFPTWLLGTDGGGRAKNWKLAINTQGPVGSRKARSDYSDGVRTTRDSRRKDDQKGDPTIPSGQQVRQRPSMGAMEFMVFISFVHNLGTIVDKEVFATWEEYRPLLVEFSMQ